MSVGGISPSWKHSVTKILGILASLIAALVWLATIATLFGLWARDHFIRYDYDDGEVAYISNVGARHKAVFIVGTALTGIFFVLTLIFTKLCFDLETRRRFKRGVSIVSIVFGVIASISLLLLAIFDSVNYKGAHYTFTGLFIVCTLISAIFTIAYRFSRNELNLSVNIRVLFVTLVIPLAITFVVMTVIKEPNNETQLKSVAASMEWSIAILFVFYLALFSLDLLLG
jgi:4-amino-4-deoxy-L-arabinose transferase-like glycosyltransferase